MAQTERPIILRGNKVALGVIIEEDLDKFWHWVNDKEVTQYLSDSLFLKIHTREMEKSWLESILKGRENTITFAILQLPNLQLIGVIALAKIDWINRNAGLGIFIGEKKLWNQGLGTEALILLLDYAFNILGLRKVYLSVFEFNKRAIKSYQKVGFKIVGKLRKHRFRAGKYWDEIIMDILAEEYNTNHKSTIKRKYRELYPEIQQEK